MHNARILSASETGHVLSVCCVMLTKVSASSPCPRRECRHCEGQSKNHYDHNQ